MPFDPNQSYISNPAGDVWQILLPDSSGWDEAATALAYNHGNGTPTHPKAIPPAKAK